MAINILQYLEKTVTWLPWKRALWDDGEEMTFEQLYNDARAMGSYLIRRGIRREPVAVLMGRRPKTVGAFLGVVYGGDYFVPLDGNLSVSRLETLLDKVQPKVVLCDGETFPKLAESAFASARVRYEDAVREPLTQAGLDMVRAKQVDTDPVCVMFSPRQDGETVGIISSHRSLAESTEQLGDILRCDSNTVFGSRTELFESACLREIMCALKYGASACLIPQRMFSFPETLLDYLGQQRINTVCWPSQVMTAAASTGALEKNPPVGLHTLAFFYLPAWQLSRWQRVLPEARFLSLYGPEEASCLCCCNEISRRIAPGENVPLGKPVPNTGILLLDEEGRDVPVGTPGEICIRGTCLSLGYFRDRERTNDAFPQNPLNPDWPERIFRTGELGRMNYRGELEYLGRNRGEIPLLDQQVAIGQVERAAQACRGVQFVSCLFRETGMHLYYTGSCTPKELIEQLRLALPRHRMPRGCYRLKLMPMTPGGSIDRDRLETIYSGEIREPSGQTGKTA